MIFFLPFVWSNNFGFFFIFCDTCFQTIDGLYLIWFHLCVALRVHLNGRFYRISFELNTFIKWNHLHFSHSFNNFCFFSFHFIFSNYSINSVTLALHHTEALMAGYLKSPDLGPHPHAYGAPHPHHGGHPHGPLAPGMPMSTLSFGLSHGLDAVSFPQSVWGKYQRIANKYFRTNWTRCSELEIKNWFFKKTSILNWNWLCDRKIKWNFKMKTVWIKRLTEN